MPPSRRVDPNPSGSVPVTTGAHSRRLFEGEGAHHEPRHLKNKGSRPRRELRKGRVLTAGAGAAAALIAVVAYVATSGSGPGAHSNHGAGSTNHSHSSTTVTTSAVTTTRPVASTTSVAPTTTRPVVSTTTTVPPSSTTTSTSTTTTTSPPAVQTEAPGNVLVEVLNGVGTPGVALQVAHALHALGFAINGVGNAQSFDHSRNLIEYGPGSLTAAETVATHVSGTPQYREYRALQRNEVWVILGSSYDGVTP